MSAAEDLLSIAPDTDDSPAAIDRPADDECEVDVERSRGGGWLADSRDVRPCRTHRVGRAAGPLDPRFTCRRCRCRRCSTPSMSSPTMPSNDIQARPSRRLQTPTRASPRRTDTGDPATTDGAPACCSPTTSRQAIDDHPCGNPRRPDARPRRHRLPRRPADRPCRTGPGQGQAAGRTVGVRHQQRLPAAGRGRRVAGRDGRSPPTRTTC